MVFLGGVGVSYERGTPVPLEVGPEAGVSGEASRGLSGSSSRSGNATPRVCMWVSKLGVSGLEVGV